MSSFDEQLEEELKRLEEEKKKKQKKNLPQTGLISTNPLGRNTASYDRVREAAKLKAKQNAIAKQVEINKAQNSWFKGGGLSDGYDFGDLTLSGLATTGDMFRGIGKGILGLGEGVVDLVTLGIGEGAELLGYDELAANAKKNAQVDLTTGLLGGTGDWLDQYSYLGGKADNITAGVGQVAGIMATAGLLGGVGAAGAAGAAGTAASSTIMPTLITSGLTFASSTGHGVTEALNSGATDGEAWTYGLIAGTADAATEMLFGGLGKGINAIGFSKGLSSADDMLAKAVSNKISNVLAKNAVQWGIKAGAEGAEEVLAGIAQAIGKKATYMSEEELSQIIADENLLEQFIVGAATSGIVQGSGVVQSTVRGQDYITGYTKNDQAVIDRVIKDRIAEAEAAGQKLTAKEKADIKAVVEEDLEKGHIPIDTIEETLGGDKYTAYQDTIQQENNALAELAELYEGDELQQKAEEFMANSKRGEAAKALRDSVFDLVKDSRLGESYREVGRRTQKFEVDLNQYTDEKQRAIVQKAVESGVLNNTNRTHDMVNWVSSMAAKLDTNFDFTNNEKLKDSIFAVDGKTVDGYVTKDGIVINVNSPKYINTVVGHEITHVLEGSNLYDALESTMIEYAKENGTYQDVMKAAYEMYHNVEGYQGADGLKKIKKEAVANMVGDYLFTDKNFISHLAKNQNVFQKMWNEVKYMVKIARAGSNEHKKLLEVQRAFEKAYQSTVRAENSATQDKNIADTKVAEKEKLKEIDLDYDIKNETVYSMSSLEDAFDYNKSEADYLASRLEYETALAKSIALDKENVTQEEMDKAKRYLDSLFLIHDMIAMDRERLDYEAAVGKSAWVSNAEYGGSIDFSTLCAKRRLFTGTFDAIQNQMPDTVLDENDFLQIRNLLLEKELESPCSMCYVEGSRAKHGVYVAKFLKEYKQTNPEWMPQIADFTSTTRLEQTRINHPEAYKAYTEAMNKLAQRKPKEASVRTDYRGEILRDFKDTSTVAEKNKNGGVRFNSFSDFEIIHAIDCMQVLTDMARVGLNGQSYTKVREFAEAFGNTGLKINLSLVAKGVDANGNLLFDETNGMKYDEAMDLRNRYSKNVGTVVVVFDQAQLEAALANDTVDFVLPFHRSQWRKSQYTMMGLPTNTKDFTSYQNDRIKNPATGRPVKLSKIKHTSQYTNDITGESFDITGNIMPNQYWDFNQDGRANAQRYLDYINENGMTPKFDFVLTKQNGKWVLPEGAVGDGYFKLLIDFKMYDNDGVGSPQTAVVPDFNMPYIQRMLENYKGGHQAFPVAHDVVEEFVQGKKSGKYSLSDENTVPGNYGNYRVSGEEIAFEEMLPMQEAPVDQTNSQTNQPVSQTNEEMLPMRSIPEQAYTTSSVGAAPYGFDPVTNLQYEYGTIPEGENPVRDDSLPISTTGKDKVSYTARTVKGARATPDGLVDLLDKETVGGRFSYIPIKNSETVQKAYNEIVKKGWEVARGEWEARVRRGDVSAELTATGALLLNNAANAGDRKTWLSVLQNYQMMGTNAGQAIQAMRILKTLSPDDSLYMIERSIEQMIDDMHTGVEITIDEGLKEAYLDAKTAEDKNAALDQIAKNVAQQIPSSFVEKWTSLRYLNMLGNFKTQVRNIFGNAGMAATSEIKNLIATGLENIAYYASGKRFHKTKSLLVSNSLLKAARNDFVNVEDIALNGGKFNDPMQRSTQFAQKVQDARRIFRFTPLEKYRQLTNYAMDKGDLVFSKAAYARILARYLKANGITETDFSKIDQMVLDKARAYAVEQAQEQTFRDNNTLSKWISKIGRRKDTPKLGKLISEGVLPFRKTPANILLRAEEYSPLGIINTAVEAVKLARGSEDVTGADVVNSLAKTFTGTGLFLVGMLLNNAGVLSGGPDEDDDREWFENQYGRQNYAIYIGDYNFTIDFFSPSAMPLLMGAQLNELRQDGDIQLNDLESALLSIADPMIEMSMLQGVNDTLDNIKYAESNMGQFLINAAVSYLTQGLTNSFLGQLERSTEEQRTTTFVDKNSSIPIWLQNTLGKMSAKTPGLDFQQIPYINAWGETEDNDLLPSFLENTLSPSYINESEYSWLYDELNRLDDMQGDYNVYPQTPDKTITYRDKLGLLHEDYNLTADQYTSLATIQGKKQKELVVDIISSREYSQLTDSEKAKAISLAYQYAKEYGRQVVLNAEGFSSQWMKDAGDNIVDAIIAHTSDERTFAYDYPQKYAFLQKHGMTYEDYKKLDEESKKAYNWAFNNPERYEFVKGFGLTATEYYSLDKDSKDAYSWAYENPEAYTVSRAVSDDLMEYYRYKKKISDIGKKNESSSGIKDKDLIRDYIFGLDLDYGQKIILYRSMYDSKADKDEYNVDIINYLNGRKDLTRDEKIMILKKLGFDVDKNGKISW